MDEINRKYIHKERERWDEWAKYFYGHQTLFIFAFRNLRELKSTI